MASDDNDRAEEYLHKRFGQFENDDCDGVIAKFNKSFHFDLNHFISLQATDLHAEIIWDISMMSLNSTASSTTAIDRSVCFMRTEIIFDGGTSPPTRILACCLSSVKAFAKTREQPLQWAHRTPSTCRETSEKVPEAP